LVGKIYFFFIVLFIHFYLLARENEPLLKDINIQLRDNFAPKEEAINRKVENAKTEGKDIFNEMNGMIHFLFFNYFTNFSNFFFLRTKIKTSIN